MLKIEQNGDAVQVKTTGAAKGIAFRASKERGNHEAAAKAVAEVREIAKAFDGTARERAMKLRDALAAAGYDIF